ncbi:MAG: YitT family protein [Oscillospiraceae bacterium]|nr:YitT family protein [Oscillospiraceae bacterium]
MIKTMVGCLFFSLGFNLFLVPNGLNAGGISGLSMVVIRFTKLGTVGLLTALVNIPLFVMAGKRIGKKFFYYSLVGMLISSISIDALSVFPAPDTEPLIGALYGGAICGLGLGIVFSTGASTGGSDIITRLLKLRYQNVPIGVITMVFDLSVAALTGLAFRDVSCMLYSGVAIFVSGRVMDTVVYSFDYSKVALIISGRHEIIADKISAQLDRGVTYLHGEGYYSGKDTKVILTAVKRYQLAELKALVSEIDPDAFVILQEAHQVLGDGFARYSRDAL